MLGRGLGIALSVDLSWGCKGDYVHGVVAWPWGDLGSVEAQLWRGGLEDQLEVGALGPCGVLDPHRHPMCFQNWGPALEGGEEGPSLLELLLSLPAHGKYHFKLSCACWQG